MTDSSGTTTYCYVPVGALGALSLQQEIGPLSGGSVGYVYYALGRVVSPVLASVARPPKSLNTTRLAGRCRAHRSTRLIRAHLP
jgi:hypothetical protein